MKYFYMHELVQYYNNYSTKFNMGTYIKLDMGTHKMFILNYLSTWFCHYQTKSYIFAHVHAYDV